VQEVRSDLQVMNSPPDECRQGRGFWLPPLSSCSRQVVQISQCSAATADNRCQVLRTNLRRGGKILVKTMCGIKLSYLQLHNV